MFCADMAIQNVIGGSFRGASWVAIHNGGGVGWSVCVCVRLMYNALNDANLRLIFRNYKCDFIMPAG